MISCPQFGSISPQRCTENQLSPFNLWDFCEKCEWGSSMILAVTGAETAEDSEKSMQNIPEKIFQKDRKPRRKLPPGMTPAVARAMGLI